MTVNRIWGFATALVVVLVLGLGWLLGVSPLLSAASAADEERATVELNNMNQQVIVDSLRAKAERVAEYTATLAVLRSTSIPATPAAQDLLVYLEDVAAGNKLDFGGAAVGAAALYTVTAEGSIAPAPGGSLAQTLYSVPLTVTVTGTSAQVLRFVNELQTSDADPGRLIIVPTLGFPELGGDTTITIEAYAFFIDDPNVPASVTAALEQSPESAAPEEETPAPEETATPAPEPTPTP